MSETLVASLGNKISSSDACYHPSIFNLQKISDREHLDKLLHDNPFIQVNDEIRSQLRELLKSRNPKLKLSREDLDEMVNLHLGDSDPTQYGVWVYYPWSHRLLHILGETEFIEVRTNRNQYKITVEERDKLGRMKVGVVGLSVGKTIAVAMAMERSYGEIRLADYDTLELTNLNRIQTGLYNLGVSKAIAVAREIAEMDPFLKTICYTDGLTEENMDDFFEKGGKLDILVEECDGLDIKILCRQKAKALGIPVVMDMNDRGTLDVERFDLEPNRPLLHGMIDHLDISRIKNLSNEEKVPYILPILGADTISSKLKASMIEIGQTITTWPQLASSVVLGGALAADVCRRIILDQFHESGRYFVDLEELICDKNVPLSPAPSPKETETELSRDEMLALLAKQNLVADDVQQALNENQIRDLITAATAAPSGANCQPWKWFYKDKFLYLFHDRIRSLSLMDFKNTASHIALGAATENLVLKAHALQLEVSATLFLPDAGKLISAFRFYSKNAIPAQGLSEPHIQDELADTIFERATNRKYGVRQKLDKKLLDRIQQSAASIPGAGLKIITSDADLQEAADIIGCVDRIRLMNEDDHHDFIHEMRWTREEAEKTQDGIDLATIELTPSELAGFQMSVTPEVIRHLNAWKGGKAFEKMGRKAIATASAVGLLTMPAFGPSHFLNGGRALQRAWLQANKLGLAIHPVSSPTFFFSRLMQGKGAGFNPAMKAELQELRGRFTKLFSLASGSGEIFLFRIHVADAVDVKALRRPVDEVLYL
jgi:nitroreductase